MLTKGRGAGRDGMDAEKTPLRATEPQFIGDVS